MQGKIRDDSFIPRWKKFKKCKHANCYILGCSNSVHKVTKLVSKERVCTFFGIDIENAEPINEEGTPLCVEHYGALYRHLNPFNKKCRTCDRSFTDPTKSRKCPEPCINSEISTTNCGPGCKCLRCCNLPDSESPEMIVDDSEDLESDSDDDLQRAVEDIFGGSDCTSELSGSDPDQRGMLTVQ